MVNKIVMGYRLMGSESFNVESGSVLYDSMVASFNFINGNLPPVSTLDSNHRVVTGVLQLTNYDVESGDTMSGLSIFVMSIFFFPPND